jgi:hypothetical protein
MGSLWLHDLPAIIAGAGLPVRTWKGWETRARSSGGYDALWGIGVHHTASNTSPDSDCRYMWEGSPDRPIGAMLLDRTGLITVGAAGATNTQGKGGPRACSKGTIPLDAGNRYTLSIEAANTGTGEPWPQVQQDHYVRLCAALCAAYGLTAGDVFAHGPKVPVEWTSRKIDPAGPSRWASGTASWDMDRFRGDVFHAMKPAPPVTPPPTNPYPGPNPQGAADMMFSIHPYRNSDTRGFGGAGLAPGQPHRFGLNPAVFPADTVAIALNVAVVGARQPGFLTVWPDGPVPDTSVVNYPGDGGAHNGTIVVGVKGLHFQLQLSTQAHLICDISAYWAP